MRFVLAGQPNSGKSTIFNGVAGYRSATANFPGSSVAYTLSRALVLGREVTIVDLPGVYTLTSRDGAEAVALRYLLDEEYDLVVNVVDASRLGRSLELTLQLLELGRPLVVALNMMDEARSKGITIDLEALAAELRVPVVPTVARRGRGLRSLFRTALGQIYAGTVAEPVGLDREVEGATAAVVALLDEAGLAAPPPLRFVAAKLLERDRDLEQRVFANRTPELRRRVTAILGDLQNAHGWPSAQVVAGSRHALAHALEDRVATLGAPRLGWRERLDRFLLHPLSGGPMMLAILGTFFWLVFRVGQRVEGPLVGLFDRLGLWVAGWLPPETLAGTIGKGVLMGVSGGVGIVLPYLIPFLVGLAILEDTGYLPRMAYILDNLMHRVGLHGKSVLPLILGYGCSVPAIMATRILESPRDRRLTTALTVFIPCSARTVVIYGLVAAFLGPWWALGVYLLNIVVVVVLGNLLARTIKGRSPGLILEIPDLRLPTLTTLLAKTWLSLKEFVVLAWPLLVGCSALLGVLEWAHADRLLNAAIAPLTVTLLGLPAAVGVTLVFGVLRKELTLVMLVQALGASQVAGVAAVMSSSQLLVFTLFVVFYVPCVATIAAMAKEVGWRDTLAISSLTIVVATVVAGAARLVLVLS